MPNLPVQYQCLQNDFRGKFPIKKTLAAILTVLLAVPSSYAIAVVGSPPIDNFWIGSSLGDLGDPNNWSEQVVPIDNNYNAILTVSGQNQTLLLDDFSNPANVRIDGINNGSMTLDHQSGFLGTGTLEIGRDGVGAYNLNSVASLNVDHLGLGVNTGSQGTFTNNGGTVTVTGPATLVVGDAGVGVFNQSSGTTIDTNLILGNQLTGNGTVNLTGGAITISGDTTVGNAGTGTFNQDSTSEASTHTINGKLILGAQAGSTGNYNLNDGVVNVGTQLIVGDNGNGTMVQTGGILNTLNPDINTNAFVVGNHTGSVGTFTQSGGAVNGGRALAIGLDGGTGTYNLNTGALPTLDTGFIALGNNNGQGTFNQQSATTNTTDSLFIGSQGTYNLEGGSLTTTGAGIGQGTIVGTSGSGALFNQTGGTHTANNLVVGNRSDGNGTYVMSGGDLSVNGRMYVGLGHDAFSPGVVNGLFQQSAGTVTAAQIYIGGFPEFIPDPIDPINNPPTFIQHLGTGRYELSDNGVVNSTVTEVGRSGNGQVLQTGGTFNAGALQLGSDGLSAIDNGIGGFDFYSSGTYDLQAGILNTTSTTVGVAGIGTFNQSGATSQHNVGGDLVVGSFRTAVEPNSGQVNQGKYNLSDGTLAVLGNSIIGAGNNDAINFAGARGASGTFTQTGGAHTVAGDLIVGQEGTAGPGAGGGGSYNISAGTLDVSGTLRLSQNNNGAVGGDASFVQSGGVVNASGFDQQGNNGANSSYTLSGGTLNSGGFGSMSDGSTFIHTDGTHNNTGFFDIGNSGGSDFDTVYNLTGATAVANFNDLVVGGFGRGIMNQSNGAVNATGQVTVGDGPNLDPARRFGEYNLSGGTLDATTNSLVIGAGNNGFAGEPGGRGTFAQTAGNVHVGTDLILGQIGSIGSGTGSYTLSGGGQVQIDRNAVIGDGGAGTFIQSNDSAILVNGQVAVGANDGSIGHYTINNNAALTIAGALEVGGSADLQTTVTGGTGVVTQNGGTVTVGNGLYIGQFGGTGDYNLNNGTLVSQGIAPVVFVGQNSVGTLTQTGGSLITHNLNVGLISGSTAAYNMSGGSIDTTFLTVGSVGSTASFKQSDDDGSSLVLVHGDLVLNSGGSYQLSQTGNLSTLNVSGTTVVGIDGAATFEQSGGTHTTGHLVLGANATGNGTYNLTGGTLNDDAIVGDAGAGTVTNSGGTHNVTGDLILGNQASGNGAYNLSATGVTTVSQDAVIGNAGTGLMTLTGNASLAVLRNTVLGSETTSSGSVNIDGAATLSTGDRLVVGLSGDSSLTQGGSSSVTTVGLRIADATDSNSVYTLNSGTLNVLDTSVVEGGSRVGISGTGTFTQNGGTHNTTFMEIGGATFGQGVGGSGTYNLNGGALVASGNISVNPTGTSGILNVAGGTLNALNIFNNGQVNYSGGAITANVNNNASFNVSGGAPRTLTGNLSNNTGGTVTVGASSPLVITGALINNTGANIAANGNITVGTDYNNLNSGSGNAFNNHANVSGPGQILAAGNVSQAITGTAVSNGTTASPVLSFGNVRVGGNITQNYQIANIGSTGPDLRGAIQTSVNGGNITDGRLSGSGVTASNFGPIGTGNNSGDLGVTLNAGNAGALSGQAVHIQNNFDNVQDQTIQIEGAVYRLAQGAAAPAPINFGNHHVGDTASQVLTVQNTAAADGFSEKLNASFGTTSGDATNNGGSINLLAAGASNNSALSVGLDTSTAGAKSGSATVNYISDGAGISGLSAIAAGSQNISLSGDVFRLASASPAAPNPVNFGNVRVGTATDQVLSLSNTAANDGFSEKLNASISSNGAPVTANGAFNLLGPQAPDSTSLHVGIDTGSAGAKVGTATIALVSDGTGTSNLGTTNLLSQNVDVSGNVYRLAQGSTTPDPIIFSNRHVGDAASQTLTVQNTAANDGFSEKLNASFGSNTGAATNNGGNLNSNLIAAGGSNNSALSVSLDTSTAGAKSGSATVNYISDGAGTSGLSAIAAGSQNISLSGDVYRLASASPAAPNPVNFGNVRVGTATDQVLSLSNTAANDGFSEKLNASISSNGAPVTANGAFNLLGPQATDSTSLHVGIDTGSAGAKAGTATIALASDGNGTSGLGITNLVSQTVNVSGDVYRLAQGAATPAPIIFSNRHVGDAASQVLTVQNTAAADGFSEKLNAGFGSNIGAATNNGGSINLLAAGGSNNSALSVSLDTSTAGAKSGSATVNYISDGAGTSGLSAIAAGSQNISLSGDVFRLASASPAAPNPVNFGNVRVGTATDQVLSLSNTAANDGFSEKLNASISSNGAPVTANGAFNLLGPQAPDSTSLHVGIDTGSAGAKAGTATIALISDGNGTSGLGTTNLVSQTVNVSGDVYRLAQGAATPAPIIFSNRHVGDAASQVLTVQNTAAADGFSEKLNASFGSNTGAATNNGGSINLLTAGDSNNSALSVSLDTSTAGAKSGSATVNYISDGAGTSGLSAIAAGSQTVNVSGDVYRLASANTLGAISFGNVHVGDSVQQALGITNTAVNDGFSEKLNASFGSATDSRITSSGSISLLSAGASNNASMVVGLNTSAAGSVNGTQTVLFASDGTGTSGLGITGLPSQNVNVSGDITTSGSVFRLASASPAAPNPVNFGNVRVGTATDQVLSLSNTAANDGFSEKLNASISSNGAPVTANGAFNLLGPLATDNSNLHVGIDTSNAGAKAGTATIALVSDGTGTSGLGTTNLSSQTVNVSGDVYRLAQGAATPAPIIFSNRHVGDTASQVLTVQNTAAADGFSEKLNASFGSTTGAATNNGGSINLLAAGDSNNSALSVNLDTSTAGAKSGSATVNYISDGAGTSGLSAIAAGSQNISLSGDVYRLASASPAAPNPVNFGNVRVGTATDQALSLSNTAANDGFSEKLNASISSNGAPVTANGAFNLLGPLATDSTSLHVGIDTGSAGAKVGTATIALVSDGNGTSGLGTTNLSSQTVNVSGAVYRLASPTLNTPSVTLAARVGDALPIEKNLSVTNSSTDVYTEGLKAGMGATAPGFTAGGSIANLAAQGTDATHLNVGLASTATSQNITGTAQVNFESTGAGTTGAPDVSVGSGLVNLAGKVYQQAVALVQNVDFGIVHVGEVVAARNVAVQNTAQIAALNDTLTGSLGGASGPFSASGNLGAGVAAGTTDSSSLSVGLDTSTAGLFTGTATASLASHNADMADLVLASNPLVNLVAQVNDFANADLRKASGEGSLLRSGVQIVLDFGNLAQGSGTHFASLDVFNNVAGPADFLDGLFALIDFDDFAFNGFNPFANLAAGGSQGGLNVAFNALTLGVFSDTIVLDSLGHNGSGFSGDLPDITLLIRANVVTGGNSVPEPESLFLVLIGLAALVAARRRQVTLH